MSTTLQSAVESYARARNLSGGTRGEYAATVKKWSKWGHAIPIEQLTRRDIREFLDWVHDQAVAEEGANYDEHIPESSIEILGHAVGGITYRHYAHRDPLAFRAIMTIPQPSAFLALIKGHDGECPCCKRPFATAD